MKIKASAFLTLLLLTVADEVKAAPANVDFTITTSEAVNVTGCPANCPRITVTVDGQTRYAQYSAGTGSSSLTFSYAPTIGDLDLDGVTLTSPIDLNGGTITDLNGNAITPLTYTVPDTSGIKIDYPSLSMDFVADADGRYTLNGTAYNDLSSFLGAAGGSYTRASTATYFDSTGTLQTAASGVPRFDHDPITHAPKGLLMEESRTNLVQNSEFTGASLGTSPPVNITFGGGAGVTATITDIGILNGESYMEVHIAGTNISGSTFYPNVSFGTFSPAAQWEDWSGRVHIISSTGTIPHGPQLQLAELTAANVYLTSSQPALVSGSYMTLTRTLSNVNVGKTRFIILTTLLNGETIDWTLKFSVPQVEKSTFLTSYIPTTGNATVTRAADSLTIPTGSWSSATIGTLFAQGSLSYLGGPKWPGLASLESSSAESMALGIHDNSSDDPFSEIYNGGVQTFANYKGSAYTPNATLKSSVAYEQNNAQACFDGQLGVIDTTTDIPAISKLRVGSYRGGGSILNGWINKIKYYPYRHTSTQLQLLTQ
ncbi:MAG: hypothetical protein PHX61_03575 [Alphaproteobacteria bacterium]|nr:hypothetical protein [Alphaproteobacteria bacterium]